MDDVVALARDLIRIDTRSAQATGPVVARLMQELAGYEIEYVPYVDRAGVAKENIVAYRGDGRRGVAFAGHFDTVPAAGWTSDPFTPRVDGDNLIGLGASDMKAAVAAMIVAANRLEPKEPVMLVLTADEETDKTGVRETVSRSRLLNDRPPKAIIVGEPTELAPIRGHRVDVQFIATAHGIQAHSSLPEGVNANITLIPFLSDMHELYRDLRSNPVYLDQTYTPPWCDLNIIVDNHGTPPNTTVGVATCRMKLRYSKSIDPTPIVEAVRSSAERHALELEIRPEASPPELPPEHALVVMAEEITGRRAGVLGLGTEASEYKKVAPPLILGPGAIDQAHKPDERISIAKLLSSLDIYVALAREVNRNAADWSAT